MDNGQFTAIITDVYKSFSAQVTIIQNTGDIPTIRIISPIFEGMPSMERFQLANDTFKKKQPDLFKQNVYLFETLASSEIANLDTDEIETENKNEEIIFKESAKELE